MADTLKKPIFIIGSTNSGTKCLFYSLVEHPELRGLKKELHFYGFQPNIDGRMNRLFSLFPNFNFNYLNETCEPRSFGVGPVDRGPVHKFLNSLMSSKSTAEDLLGTGQRAVFKDPKLSLRIKWLKHIYPDCYIVAIIRNPWATIEGIVRRLHIYGDIQLNLDVPTATAQWHITNTIIDMESKDIDNFYMVRYEDMISASKFPDSVESNCFWSRLLSHLDLGVEGFQIPNKHKYTNFDVSKNSDSLKNLTPWQVNYISNACVVLNNKYGYSINQE